MESNFKSLFFSDEYDSGTGILLRTCEENVAVNKCEGQCASSIYPSARNALGFHKVDTITFYILPNCIKCTFGIETSTYYQGKKKNGMPQFYDRE